MAEQYRWGAYYEDATGFLWQWAGMTPGHRDRHRWFPQADPPTPASEPVMPVRMVYDEYGYSTSVAPWITDGGMYALKGQA